MKILTSESTITELLNEINKVQPISQSIEQLAIDFEKGEHSDLIADFVEEQQTLGAELDHDPISYYFSLSFVSQSGQNILMFGDMTERHLELDE